MNHQQFENWILLDTDLTQNEQRALHQHLKDCSHCQALYQAIHQLDHLFTTTPEPAPAVGFSARWKDRIEKQEKRRNRLILGITLSVISLATAILLSLVGLEIRAAIGTFPQMLLQLVTTIADWIVFLNQISNVLTPLVRVGTKLISPLWVYTLVFGLGGGAAVWVISSLRSRNLQKELNQ